MSLLTPQITKVTRGEASESKDGKSMATLPTTMSPSPVMSPLQDQIKATGGDLSPIIDNVRHLKYGKRANSPPSRAGILNGKDSELLSSEFSPANLGGIYLK